MVEVWKQFRQQIEELLQERRQLESRRLTEFLEAQTQLLREGERLPLSTEILESTFGLYKQNVGK